MAKKGKKKSKSRASNHRKGNPSTAKHRKPSYSAKTLRKMLSKKTGGKKKSGASYGRNPFGLSIFGERQPGKVAGILVAGVGGLTIAKLVTPMLPANWLASDFSRFLSTLGVAVATSAAAHFVLPAPYRDGVIFGAGMQTVSVGLNPLVRKVTSSVTLGRLKDFVPGSFPEPQNPIWQRMAISAGAAGGSSTSSGGNMGRYRGRFN